MSVQDFQRDLRASYPSVCEHIGYTVLRNHRGTPTDDHDTMDAKCRVCGQLVSVTEFYNGRLEITPMDAGYAKRQGYTR